MLIRLLLSRATLTTTTTRTKLNMNKKILRNREDKSRGRGIEMPKANIVFEQSVRLAGALSLVVHSPCFFTASKKPLVSQPAQHTSIKGNSLTGRIKQY